MKITKSKLKQIITEELHNILVEQEDGDGPGDTQFFKPGEREAMRKARAGAETQKIDVLAMDRKRRSDAKRKPTLTSSVRRAETLMSLLYPGVTSREMIFTIRQEDDEGNLADSLFGFLFPRETAMDKPNPVLMSRVEEWIATFDNPEDAALEVRGRTNTENLESLFTYIEKKSMEIGKDMFARAKADADAAGPAKDVPVGRAATPGTQEYDALQALMKVDTPPKRRR